MISIYSGIKYKLVELFLQKYVRIFVYLLLLSYEVNPFVKFYIVC